MDGQMKRGVLEMCILQLIEGRQRYGYEIMKEVTAAFPDVNESTAYAILRRLLGDGKLAVAQGQEPGGASRRKYYSLTELGNRSLEEARESWREISRTVAGFGI